MEYLYQKVSYLKGLAEGLEIDETSKEGKLLLNIIDTLEDFADVIGETKEDYDDLEEYVSYIDEDLSDVEDEIYGFDDDFYLCEDFDDEYDNDDNHCDECEEVILEEE